LKPNEIHQWELKIKEEFNSKIKDYAINVCRRSGSEATK
jgi:hypothetical protein